MYENIDIGGSTLTLKELRISKGVSVKKMTDYLHISKPTYYRIELDPLRQHDYLMADEIANLLEVPVETIFPQFKRRLSPDSDT